MKKIFILIACLLVTTTSFADRQFTRDYGLEVSRGNISGVMNVNKFGAAPDAIDTAITDIWGGAITTNVWVAPTQARRHQLLSTSDEDSDTGGTVAQGGGARTVEVFGLATWGTAESSEMVTMDGTATGGNAVWTTGTYVIVHRVKVITSGATSINVGTITAIAETDGSITAKIDPLDGQTEMAIYGVPSTQKFYLIDWVAGIDKAQGAASSADFHFMMNPNPDVQLGNFIRKQDISVQSTGANVFQRRFKVYPSYSGPCILKVQATASANGIDGHAQFDGYVVDN